MKKRILQLIGSFHVGGSEKQAVGLTQKLAFEGSLDVFVATLNSDGILRAELDVIGRAIPEFRLTSFYNANFIQKVRECASFIKINQIDLVHTHDFYTNVFGMAAATLAGPCKCIASKRETFGVRTKTQEFVEGIAFKRADAVVVNSSSVRDLLMRRSVNPDKICTIFNGVDSTPFSIQRDRVKVCQSLGLPADMKVVTMVANLRHDVKNVPMLLRVAQHVGKRLPDVCFAIAGEGHLNEGLRKMADDLGVRDNVRFLGHCSDVPALLFASDACVLTSTAEGFSNALLEYMAAGKPVVATNVGGAAEAVVNGVTGYLVEPNDDAGMADYIIQLLQKEEIAKAFGVAAQERVALRFSKEAQLRGTLGLYRSVLALDK